MIEMIKPMDIEKKSMEIIESNLNGREWSEPEFSVVKRCIHTSADFDYADNLRFSKGAAEKGMNALRNGAHIVTDTSMAAAGINKRVLERYGGKVHCFIGDLDVAEKAKTSGWTRSAVSMDKASELDVSVIFAIGNAPTALIRLKELIDEGKIKPELVIGVPVGFVNVIESKEMITETDIPYIVAVGRKGGSNIAAAICNALLYYGVERSP